MGRKRTGTREWAKSTVNIQLGCEHNCRYCYARHRAVKISKWCTAEQWLDPVIVQSKVTRSFLKRLGVVMYPSAHDITPRNISESICVLRKLLKAGNDVLVVSKPHFDCIHNICESFLEYRKRLMFRFTIGSLDDYVLKFWEPNAPCFKERLTCLQYAYDCGYPTSISCEPFLDGWDNKVDKIVGLYKKVKPYVTDSIWIGKLREFNRRVEMSGVTSEEKKMFVEPLKAAQADETVWAIYEQLKDERPVRWKDSIREVIEK